MLNFNVIRMLDYVIWIVINVKLQVWNICSDHPDEHIRKLVKHKGFTR